MLLMQYYFTNWKIAPCVHGVRQDKVIDLGEEDGMLPEYRNNQLQVVVNFYGKEAMVEFGGKTYTSPPLVMKNKCLLSRGFSREP